MLLRAVIAEELIFGTLITQVTYKILATGQFITQLQ